MIGVDDANALYDGLIELLLQDGPFQGRMNRVVDEVTSVIAQGRPSATEIRFTGQRSRERVQQVVPLSPIERLALLVDAIEFALILPVDLAAACMATLTSEEVPSVDLVFERDVAADLDSISSVHADTTAQSASVTITSAQVDEAHRAVSTLRSALAEIKAELES